MVQLCHFVVECLAGRKRERMKVQAGKVSSNDHAAGLLASNFLGRCCQLGSFKAIQCVGILIQSRSRGFGAKYVLNFILRSFLWVSD